MNKVIDGASGNVGSLPSSAIGFLGDLVQVTLPLCALILSLFVKWDW